MFEAAGAGEIATESVPESALESQMNDATDSLQKSFAGSDAAVRGRRCDRHDDQQPAVPVPDDLGARLHHRAARRGRRLAMPNRSPIVLDPRRVSDRRHLGSGRARDCEGGGRRVIVATLTGLERRRRSSTEAVALDTHIRDVVALLRREDLHDVMLVGHSYAGMIITGVAEHAQTASHISSTSTRWCRNTGSRRWTSCREPTRETFRNLAEHGGGWRMRPNDHLLDLWGARGGSGARRSSRRGCATSRSDASRSRSRRRPTRHTRFLARTSRA